MGNTECMARFDPINPSTDVMSFVTERHLATLTVVKADATPHVTPVGFTYDVDAQLVRVITWSDSWKAKHIASQGSAAVAVSSVDGGRWLTFSGTGTVTSEPDRVAEGVRRYAERYRAPKERDDRVVIEIAVDKIVGRL